MEPAGGRDHPRARRPAGAGPDDRGATAAGAAPRGGTSATRPPSAITAAADPDPRHHRVDHGVQAERPGRGVDVHDREVQVLEERRAHVRRADGLALGLVVVHARAAGRRGRGRPRATAIARDQRARGAARAPRSAFDERERVARRAWPCLALAELHLLGGPHGAADRDGDDDDHGARRARRRRPMRAAAAPHLRLERAPGRGPRRARACGAPAAAHSSRSVTCAVKPPKARVDAASTACARRARAPIAAADQAAPASGGSSAAAPGPAVARPQGSAGPTPMRSSSATPIGTAMRSKYGRPTLICTPRQRPRRSAGRRCRSAP